MIVAPCAAASQTKDVWQKGKSRNLTKKNRLTFSMLSFIAVSYLAPGLLSLAWSLRNCLDQLLPGPFDVGPWFID